MSTELNKTVVLHVREIFNSFLGISFVLFEG